MLEPDRWDEVLSRMSGKLYRGTERISSAAIMDALGVPAERQARAKEGKRARRPVPWS
jgi:hypothetical protein